MTLSVTQREVVSPKTDFVGFVGLVNILMDLKSFFVGFVGPVHILVFHSAKKNKKKKR